LGFDLSYSPLSLLDVSGAATWSLEAQRAKDIRGTLALQPLRPLSLNVGYHFSSPDLWLPRTSIFAVFSEEAFQEASIDTLFKATRKLSFEAGYGRRFYSGELLSQAQKDGEEKVTGANRASARATLRFGEGGQGRAVAEVERLEARENAASRIRLASVLPVPMFRRQINFIVDLDCFLLDEAIRDTTASFTGAGYAEVPLQSNLRLLFGASGSVTPLLRHAGSLLVRLIWEFESPGGMAGVEVQRGRLGL